MKIFTFIGRKGGITKTTLATNTAAACARAGLRTLLVDADGQGNSSSVVGIKPHDGLFDLILGDMEFQDVMRPVPKDFAAVDMYLLSSWVNHRELENNADVPNLIYDRFAELEGWADVVIVDTGPSITAVHTGFYYRSDYVLLPTTPESTAILSLQSTIAYLQSARDAGAQVGFPAAEPLGIIPNRFSMKENVDQANYAFLKTSFSPIHVFDMMRNLTIWKQATQVCRSVFTIPLEDHSTKSNARKAVADFQPIVDAVLRAAGIQQVAS